MPLVSKCGSCFVPFDVEDLDENNDCAACRIINADDKFTDDDLSYLDQYDELDDPADCPETDDDADFEDMMLDDFIVFHDTDWT